MNKKHQRKVLVGVFLFWLVLGAIGIAIDHLDWFIIFSFAWLIFTSHMSLDNQIEFGREILKRLDKFKEDDEGLE